MAQYRAIFQNAYFKGLATAAVVTMGLAVGQAQAADITQMSDLATAGEKVIKTAKDVNLTADTNSKWNADLVISSGTSGHTLKANADGDKVTGTGSLTLQDADTSKLTIGAAEAKGLSVSLNAITISQGELTIQGGTGKITSVRNCNQLIWLFTSSSIRLLKQKHLKEDQINWLQFLNNKKALKLTSYLRRLRALKRS